MTWLGESESRLQRFRAGDNELLAQAYQVYARDLEAFLRAKVADNRGFRLSSAKCDVHDVLQETFLRAFSDAARLRYDESRPFAAYLRSIARNYLVDQYRSQLRHLRSLQSESQRLPMHASSVEDEIETRRKRAMCRCFAESLDERQRVVFGLLLGICSRRQVAQATGYTPYQVRKFERELQDQLRKCLKGGGRRKTRVCRVVGGLCDSGDAVLHP